MYRVVIENKVLTLANEPFLNRALANWRTRGASIHVFKTTQSATLVRPPLMVTDAWILWLCLLLVFILWLGMPPFIISCLTFRNISTSFISFSSGKDSYLRSSILSMKSRYRQSIQLVGHESLPDGNFNMTRIVPLKGLSVIN